MWPDWKKKLFWFQKWLTYQNKMSFHTIIWYIYLYLLYNFGGGKHDTKVFFNLSWQVFCLILSLEISFLTLTSLKTIGWLRYLTKVVILGILNKVNPTFLYSVVANTFLKGKVRKSRDLGRRYFFRSVGFCKERFSSKIVTNTG